MSYYFARSIFCLVTGYDSGKAWVNTMRMKILKIVMTLVLCSLAISSLSCASESKSTQIEGKVVEVQRGNLVVDIPASGNLALSLKEDLAFEMSGTVEEILVEEGDSVEEGQVLAKLDTSEWERNLRTLEIDVMKAKINLKSAELALEKAEEPTDSQGNQIAPDPLEVDMRELQVEEAEARLEDAQEALDEVLDASPEITAPFDGFITKVNVDGGDEVKKGTVAAVIADPNKFEADIFVSEMDIFQVKLGGEASVQVDAMQGLSLPAKVAHISPTATIQQGVVNYKVKVEVESLEVIMQEWEQARQEAMEQRTVPGELPERLKQAIEEGQITQEQAEEMLKQMQQTQGGQQGQTQAMIPEDFQLREGMTVTVSIIVDERNDVLLVPNSAITIHGRQTYVQVLLPDGTVEERTITTGISDWQYTEVTGGLNEGEKVIVPQGTTTTPTTPQQWQSSPGGIVPWHG